MFVLIELNSIKIIHVIGNPSKHAHFVDINVSWREGAKTMKDGCMDTNAYKNFRTCPFCIMGIIVIQVQIKMIKTS